MEILRKEFILLYSKQKIMLMKSIFKHIVYKICILLLVRDKFH